MVNLHSVADLSLQRKGPQTYTETQGVSVSGIKYAETHRGLLCVMLTPHVDDMLSISRHAWRPKVLVNGEFLSETQIFTCETTSETLEQNQRSKIGQ